MALCPDFKALLTYVKGNRAFPRNLEIHYQALELPSDNHFSQYKKTISVDDFQHLYMLLFKICFINKYI